MIDQGELFTIPSPCKRICEVNNRGYCKGCFRSREERLNWLKYSDFQRQLIINLCEKRRLKVLAAKQARPEEKEVPLPPQPDLFDPPAALTADVPAAEAVITAEPQPGNKDSRQTSPTRPQAAGSAAPEPPSSALPTDIRPATEAAAEKSTVRTGKARKSATDNDSQLDMFS